MVEQDVCIDCNRKRDVDGIWQDYDYRPFQVITGLAPGWYSHPDEGDLCGQCFNKLLKRGN
jgi:hypothetical protein